jgi:hypothetical protein
MNAMQSQKQNQNNEFQKKNVADLIPWLWPSVKKVSNI